MKNRNCVMMAGRIFIIFILLSYETVAPAQVKIRLYSNQTPESAVFSVSEGRYEINCFNSKILTVSKNEPVLMSRFNGRLAVKIRNEKGIICDSLTLSGITGNDSFSLRVNGKVSVRQFYSGDLQCFPDMGTILFINKCDVEKYISGVVMAEGGTGHDLEYVKSQAIIARTYLYKFIDKHLSDRYNVCDNTHCQAFNGLASDSLITRAAHETKGLVILDKDSVLILAAFHSNCGGETASSGDVWLSGQPYLKSLTDPFCSASRNAVWRRSLTLNDWVNYLRKSGYTDNAKDPAVLNFLQKERSADYISGSFTLALSKIRADLNLRSTFFSVYATGDSVELRGRGYGHGVGLCQEGAMTMARKGYNYKAIINFYYSGVSICDVKNAVILPAVLAPDLVGKSHDQNIMNGSVRGN
jgi:stage II sporulation protein D